MKKSQIFKAVSKAALVIVPIIIDKVADAGKAWAEQQGQKKGGAATKKPN